MSERAVWVCSGCYEPEGSPHVGECPVELRAEVERLSSRVRYLEKAISDAEKILERGGEVSRHRAIHRLRGHTKAGES